ncbi:MAG TPA: IS4 family transposase [Anaeromyxobacteraceae bacterium]|nr:IS4 family transposase [Anaeromyxobacteraceae bacterium]
MPRRPISDRLALAGNESGELLEQFRASLDPDWIGEALEATGTATIRKRRLPAEQVIWLVLGMGIYRNKPITEIVAELNLALPGRRGPRAASSSVTQARDRLGDEPIRWLFERCAEVWAHESARRHAWRGLAVYGVDGTTLRLPDSDANREHFGCHSGTRGESGYPMARLVTLMALRSHLLAAARFAPQLVGELALAKEIWPLVPDESLCIVDRNFLSAGLLIGIAKQGHRRHWLTRAKKNTDWKVLRTLGRGDWLVEKKVSQQARAEDPTLPERWEMRAIRYHRKGFRPQTLLTSMVDAEAYPASEVVALYHERWEIELGYGEVKTVMLAREESTRSRTPRGVSQELWGLALAYNLVRLEMERIAAEAGVTPDRISFKGALMCIEHALLTLSLESAGRIPEHLRRLREDVAHFILPKRRQRSYPRAVKIKMSNYPRKRRGA